MKRYLKRHWCINVFLCIILILLYLIIGAIVPFVKYKKISPETVANTNIVDRVYDNNKSPDRAKLLESNLSAWEDRIRLFEKAQHRIILSTFDMREGNSTKDLAAVLYKRAEDGIKISILVDGMNGWYRMHNKPFFYALSTHPNIEIRFYNKINLIEPWKTQGRMHDKYVIVDDYAYILGGRNTFDYFIGDYPTKGKSYDREVLIYNTKHGTENKESSLYELEAYFESVWNSKYCENFGENVSKKEKEQVEQKAAEFAKHYETLKEEKKEYFEAYDYAKHTEETNGVSLISGDIGIYGKEPKVLYQLEQLMLQATDRVRIHTPYAVCNDYMYNVLSNVENKVGNVTMLLNSVENGDNICASSDYRINKKDLIKTGITIYEYDGGTSYHGKSIVIDDKISIVGSFNYDLRSAYMDTELMVAVNSKSLTKELTNYMDTMQNDSRKVLTETEYETPAHITVEPLSKKKDITMQILGHVSQLFRYLL